MGKKKGVSTEKAKAKEAKKAKAEKKAEKRDTKKTKGGPARGGDDDEDLDAILEKVKSAAWGLSSALLKILLGDSSLKNGRRSTRSMKRL